MTVKKTKRHHKEEFIIIGANNLFLNKIGVTYNWTDRTPPSRMNKSTANTLQKMYGGTISSYNEYLSKNREYKPTAKIIKKDNTINLDVECGRCGTIIDNTFNKNPKYWRCPHCGKTYSRSKYYNMLISKNPKYFKNNILYCMTYQGIAFFNDYILDRGEFLDVFKADITNVIDVVNLHKTTNIYGISENDFKKYFTKIGG